MRVPLALIAALLVTPIAVTPGVSRGAGMARQSVPAPPPTPTHAASTTLHGVIVNDPFRWLEDPADPAVQQWIAAQNTYTEAVLAAMPDGDALNARVQQLAVTTTTRSAPRLAGATLFYLRETPPQPQPVLVAERWPTGDPRVIVDLNASGGNSAITDYWPSPTGRYVAYGTAEGGDELTTIHVLEVATGRVLTDALPWAAGATTPPGVGWDADEHGFVYVRFQPPAPGRAVEEFHAALAHHTMGQAPAADAVVFGQDYSRIAEYRLLSSPGGRQLAVVANIGDGGPADIFLREGAAWKQIVGQSADARDAAWIGQRLFVSAFAGAPRGKVVTVGADGRVVDVLAQSERGALQMIRPIASGFLVVRSWGADWWVEQYSAAAALVRRVPLPASGIDVGDIASEAGQARALISYSGWKWPVRWAEFDAASGALKTVFQVTPPADYSRIQVTTIDGTSKDGTRIPVTVLSLPPVTPNGARPTILYSYGGFGLPVQPRFAGSNLAWLERGGILAYANIRGGNEFGEAWHRQGQRLDKQNVFDDFYAAAIALERARWTNRDHLGILGGSNGGLLMGAEVTQHPDAWGAVVAQVGIYDVLRHETEFANGAYNVTEYGSIQDAAQFRATLAYSPLQNVRPGVAYPAVLMITGANDSRVAPWQSRKFTAALQTASAASPAAARRPPILLLTRMDAGHGIGAPFSQRVGNAAITLTFFAHELGLGPAPR